MSCSRMRLRRILDEAVAEYPSNRSVATRPRQSRRPGPERDGAPDVGAVIASLLDTILQCCADRLLQLALLQIKRIGARAAGLGRLRRQRRDSLGRQAVGREPGDV